MVEPNAPMLQTLARYCTKQHEIKLCTRKNDIIKRRSKHKVYEAAASLTGHAVFQQNLFFKVKKV